MLSNEKKGTCNKKSLFFNRRSIENTKYIYIALFNLISHIFPIDTKFIIFFEKRNNAVKMLLVSTVLCLATVEQTPSLLSIVKTRKTVRVCPHGYGTGDMKISTK